MGGFPRCFPMLLRRKALLRLTGYEGRSDDPIR